MQKRPDVAIVGGGAIGLACAWRLAQSGARVAVFERGEIGREASWAAGGMLAPMPEFLVHPSGESARAMLQLGLESRDLYADFAAELLQLTGVDIELCLRHSPTHDWREAGILLASESAICDDAQSRMWNGRNAVWFADEGQVEPRILVEALRVACLQSGVEIHQNSPVRRIEIENERIVAVVVGESRIEVEAIVWSAGAWSGQTLVLPDEAIAPIRPVAGQMLQLRGGHLLPHIVYGEDCYLIPRRDGRLLVGATVEEIGFEKRVTPENTAQLLNAARELAPIVGEMPLENSWAGLRPTSPDGLPILGRGPIENLHYATGHGRNGILLAPRTAEIITGIIMRGDDAPEAFEMARFDKHRAPLVDAC